MWKDLDADDKEEYKRLLLALASLSEMFAQKSKKEEDGETKDGKKAWTLAPILSSKFQETAFQNSFGASAEDVGNTSFDSSLDYSKRASGKKYLVGIKTFGIGTGYQKVAQFKQNMGDWDDLVNEIKKASVDDKGKPKAKKEIDKSNHDRYLKIAKSVSALRNDRINSSKAKLRGFKVEDDDDLEMAYHVVMPSPKDAPPSLSVGEIEYSEIDVENVAVTGCTTKTTPVNFNFTDGKHNYRYTAADCQLWMDFQNDDIVEETWEVKYLDDPYALFSDIADRVLGVEGAETRSVPPASGATVERATSWRRERHVEKRPTVTASFCWKLTNKDGEVERYSGLNAFYGVGSKLEKSANVTDAKLRTLRRRNNPACEYAIMQWTASEGKPKREREIVRIAMLDDAKRCAETLERYETYDAMMQAFGTQREKSIRNLVKDYGGVVDASVLTQIERGLRAFLLDDPNELSTEEKEELRKWMTAMLEGQKNKEFRNEVMKMIYRPEGELYIPIPKARKFHEKAPAFFREGAAEFKPNSHKLAKSKEDRCFELKFEPSGDSMTAFISQDDGKGISSYEQQTRLGEWLLREVFRLPPHEPLTEKRLGEMGVNGVRLYRTDADDAVHLEFIWIDDENLPEDYWPADGDNGED